MNNKRQLEGKLAAKTMKKVKEKITLRALFWALSIGLSFLSIVHAQNVPIAPSSRPITPLTVNTPKSLQKKSATPKISQGLMDLYKAYQARDGEGSGDPEGAGSGVQPSLPTTDGFVTIDAIASKDAGTLKTDMEALGLKNSAMFGRVVSGLFPIAEIPKLSDLKSLKFARAALAQTHN